MDYYTRENQCTNDMRVKYIKIYEKYLIVSASDYRCRKITRPYARLFIWAKGWSSKRLAYLTLVLPVLIVLPGKLNFIKSQNIPLLLPPPCHRVLQCFNHRFSWENIVENLPWLYIYRRVPI